MIGAVFDRLDWADEHLKSLVDETNSFLKTKPYGLVSEVDRQTGHHIIHFRVVREDSALTLRLSDCIHHLRAALDNLAWELALLNTPVPYDRTQFPICATPRAFKHDGLRQIQSIDSTIGALIEQDQPYNRGPQGFRSDLLWLLNELSRIDKHRHLHVIGGAPTAGTIYVAPLRDCEFVGSINRTRQIVGAFKDGAEVARDRIQITGPHPEMTMNDDITYGVFVDEVGPLYSRQVWELVHDLRDRVRGAITALSRFF